MPLPKHNLSPHFNVSRLSHIELNVKDLGASHAFYVDTFGLQVTDQNDNFIYLRGMEERGHHCVIIKKSETANNGQIVVALIDDHEAMLKRLRKKGKVIALESANKRYETKIFGPDRVKVQGVLVSLYRNFQ